MMERLERLTTLGGDYAATLAALARTEVRQDVERIRKAMLGTAIGVAMAVLGGLWLNVAVLLLLLRTDYPIVGAAVLGSIALVVGIVFIARAWRNAEQLRMLEATRRVLADEFGAGVPPGLVPVAAAAPMMPAEASARLRELREEMRETVSLGAGPRVELVNARGEHFEPRSRTMRVLLWVWAALPRVPSGTAVAGTLGVLAVSSPKLRRLLALLALARNLGGGSGHRAA
jgi:hypothetical protein